MLRILAASSVLALAAAPAIAQQPDPSASPMGTQTPSPTEPSSAPGPMADPAMPAAPADPATPATAADPATPGDGATRATPADPATPAAPGREAQVTKVVNAEFPIYDANKNGDLDQPEFSKWVLALHSASNDPNAKAMDDAAKAKWATDAFASADTDKNNKISKAEISKFLMG